MPVTLVINLCKWPSGNLRCHPCIALFHRWLEAHFKVQLIESSYFLFDPYLSNWQWSEIFTELLFAASSLFKPRKHTSMFWLQLKILWRALNLRRNDILHVIRVSINQDQSFLVDQPCFLNVQLALCSRHQDGPKKYSNLIIKNCQTHPALD